MKGIDLSEMIHHTASWLQGTGPDAEIVISSRVRLARNLKGVFFPHKLEENASRDVVNRVRGSVEEASITRDFAFLELSGLPDTDRMILAERHLVSPEHAQAGENRAVAISEDESVSIMINEEDHLRLQVLLSGFQLEKALEDANRIDEELEETLDYAFSPTFGYLTACPTNVGSGLRASVMIHLPALVLNKQIDQVLQAVNKLGLAVRGWFGEGSKASGNLFQISNQVTLGKTGPDIVEHLVTIVRQIIQHERNARRVLLKKDLSLLQDRIGRAFGTLKFAHIIPSAETMNLISSLRIGIELGLLKNMDVRLINELFLLSQPAHIQKIVGKELSPLERDQRRARMIREMLRKEKLDWTSPG